MQFSEPFHELIYQNEILRAKLEIRDHYFKSVVREIYENTGQVLSLVRIKLATVGSQLKGDQKTHLLDSGDLVGQVICDLRNMSRNFYPEREILSESGLINALKRELKVELQDNSGKKIKVKGVPFILAPGSGLIFFLIILEITCLVAKSYGEDSLGLEIIYTNTELCIGLNYSGEPIDLTAQAIKDDFSVMRKLSIEERLKLIGGKWLIKNPGSKRCRIDISIPYEIETA